MKKKIISVACLCTAVLMSFSTVSAAADYNGKLITDTKTQNVFEKQTPAAPTFTKYSRVTNSVRLYWSEVDCEKYEIYTVSADNSYTLAYTIAHGQTNKKITGLTPHTTYKYAIRAVNGDNTDAVYSEYSDTYSVTTKDAVPTAPDTTAIKSASRTYNSIRLNWTAVKCDGYRISQTQGTEKAIYYAAADAVSFKTKNLKQLTEYSFTITPFNVNADGVRTYAAESYAYVISTKADPSLVVAPAPITYTSGSRTKNAIRVNWAANKCDGYDVYMKKYSEPNSAYKFMTNLSGSATSYKATGLEMKTRYTVRIRAYNLSGSKKIYSKYSDNIISTRPVIQTKNGMTYVDGVLVANKTYSLPSSYNPGGLTSATNSAFTRLQQAAAKDGISLWICSGFRSYATQQAIYNNYVYRDGQAIADTYSARPGYSEHQTGLALDVNNASDSFAGTKEAKWLAKNCYKYGFIIRYPSDKVSITGYKYEPWHIRYVGKSLATKVTQSGLCLEEYLGITSQYKN